MTQNAYRPPTQFAIFPPVIKNLLIICGLVFMAQLVPTTAWFLQNWFALWPLGVPDVVRDDAGRIIEMAGFWPWQLLTYGFLHGDFSHLFFNLFALWMFGLPIEQQWGSRRFGIYYFVCVIGAGAVQLLVSTLEPGLYPTVGASGGVFGILLAFGMLFPDQPIYFIFFPVPIKAKWFVVGYGAFELFAGVTGTMPGVAHFAHLAGLGFGLLMILYWRGKLPVRPRQRVM